METYENSHSTIDLLTMKLISSDSGNAFIAICVHILGQYIGMFNSKPQKTSMYQ